MTGTDGHGCSWRLYSGVAEEIRDLGAQGEGLVREAMRRYGKGTALPRHVDHLGDGLYELRTSQGNNHYRLIFFMPIPFIAVGLHAFYKNSRRTPKPALDLAQKRKKLWESRPGG